MRFLHTSDWHLGRLFYGIHLTEDQSYVLDQFINLVKDTSPDCVIIAGDIFDRAVPPAEAVLLFDDILTRLSKECKTPVIAIAGNHDGPDRLSFAGRLLVDSGIHIFGRASARPDPVIIHHQYGPVAILPIPFTEPALAREILDDRTLQGHDECLGALLKKGAESIPGNMRSIVVSHAFVKGGLASESERPVSVGGSGEVSPHHFSPFNYSALGHLHRPQKAGLNGRIRYSGSLLGYSFSELGHKKSILLAEMDREGEVVTTPHTLTPKRELRKISGELNLLLKGPGPGKNREDYILVELLDKRPVLDPMGRLREIYPNVLHIERPGLLATMKNRGEVMDPAKMDDLELFKSFIQEIMGREPDNEEIEVYSRVVGDLRREEREVDL